MRVLLTGASGLIGRRVCGALLRRGDNVVGVTRSARLDGDRLRWVRGEPTDWRTYETAINTCDAVVNLAGEPLLGLWTAARRQRIVKSRVGTTQAVVRAITSVSTRPQVFVSGSAVGFYGSDPEACFDEEAPAGAGFLAEVCRRWEAAAIPAESAGVRTVLLRTGAVLARDGGLLPLLVRSLKLYGGAILGDGRQWMAWVHIDDVVGMILRALDEAAWRGPVNAVAPGPVRQHEMLQTLGRVLQRPVWLRLPAWALALVLGDLGREVLLGGQHVEPARAIAFGYCFEHPLLGGAIRDLLVESSG